MDDPVRCTCGAWRLLTRPCDYCRAPADPSRFMCILCNTAQDTGDALDSDRLACNRCYTITQQ